MKLGCEGKGRREDCIAHGVRCVHPEGKVLSSPDNIGMRDKVSKMLDLAHSALDDRRAREGVGMDHHMK